MGRYEAILLLICRIVIRMKGYETQIIAFYGEGWPGRAPGLIEIHPGEGAKGLDQSIKVPFFSSLNRSF